MKSWLIVCFLCNKTENFILLLKYCQRKVDLNASKKSLVFVTTRHRKYNLYVQLSFTKISYLRKSTHLQKNSAFWHFHSKKSSENIIFPWNENIRKLTKMWFFCPVQKFLWDENYIFHVVRTCINYQDPWRRYI